MVRVRTGRTEGWVGRPPPMGAVPGGGRTEARAVGGGNVRRLGGGGRSWPGGGSVALAGGIDFLGGGGKDGGDKEDRALSRNSRRICAAVMAGPLRKRSSVRHRVRSS